MNSLTALLAASIAIGACMANHYPHTFFGGAEGGHGGAYGGAYGGGYGGGDGGHHGGHGHEDFHSPAHYTFEYGVHDPHSHDIKEQKEHRDHDHVKGGYTLKESDGTQRVVEYNSDPHHGFQAVVKRVGHAQHPAVYGKHHGHGLGGTSYVGVTHWGHGSGR